MAVPLTPRLADVITVGSTITVTVPYVVLGGDDEGIAASGTATYTIVVPAQTTALQALCDDLDRLAENGIATIS